SKINQWTLLVAMLPLVYSIALGAPTSLPLDERQREEVLLTAAQSLFAVTLLLDLRLSVYGAAMLAGLFLLQMVLPETRGYVTIAYFVLAAAVAVLQRRHIGRAFAWVRRRPGVTR
ncbi:MAG TPA: sodium:calcium antiporter, partial [Candidatus Limnocylindria bacterium]